MRVALGVLADYANVAADGKLNIMGVFQVVYAAQFPHVHPQMHLVLTLEADLSEAGKRKQLEIKLMGPDGAPLLGVGGEMEVPKGSPVRRQRNRPQPHPRVPGCSLRQTRRLPVRRACWGRSQTVDSAKGPSGHPRPGAGVEVSVHPQSVPVDSRHGEQARSPAHWIRQGRDQAC